MLRVLTRTSSETVLPFASHTVSLLPCCLRCHSNRQIDAVSTSLILYRCATGVFIVTITLTFLSHLCSSYLSLSLYLSISLSLSIYLSLSLSLSVSLFLSLSLSVSLFLSLSLSLSLSESLPVSLCLSLYLSLSLYLAISLTAHASPKCWPCLFFNAAPVFTFFPSRSPRHRHRPWILNSNAPPIQSPQGISPMRGHPCITTSVHLMSLLLLLQVESRLPFELPPLHRRLFYRVLPWSLIHPLIPCLNHLLQLPHLLQSRLLPKLTKANVTAASMQKKRNF